MPAILPPRPQRPITKAMLWVLLEKAGQQGLQLVFFFITARLLGPEAFGLAGLCAVFPAIAYMLLNGLADAVITLQLQQDKPLSTLFWFILAVGAALSGLSFLAAPWFAAMMAQPQLVGLLRWLSLIPLLGAVAAVPTAMLQARMDFKVFTLRAILATLVAGVAGIGLALQGAGAYSLIAQQLINQIVINGVIWRSVRWYPSLHFDGANLKTLLTPGVQMLGSALLEVVEQYFPRILIGFFLGPVMVGYFVFAARIFLALREVLVLPVNTVLYPALARIRTDASQVKPLLHKVFLGTAYGFFPTLFGLIQLLPALLPLFFGAKWQPATPMLQVFLLAAFSQPFLLIIRDTLRAYNQTAVFFRWQMAMVGSGCVMQLLLTPLGLLPMLWGAVAVNLLFLPLFLKPFAKHLPIGLLVFYCQLAVPLLAAAAMLAVLAAATAWLPPNPWQPLLLIVLGIVVYGGLVAVANWRLVRGVLRRYRTA